MASFERLDPAIFKPADRFSIALFEAALYGRYHTAFVAQTEPKLIAPVTVEQMTLLANELRPYLKEGTSKREHVAKRLATALSILEP